jgi:hypothetical protein
VLHPAPCALLFLSHFIPCCSWFSYTTTFSFWFNFRSKFPAANTFSAALRHKVISIPTFNVPIFLSFPLNPFPPNFILFIRIVFEPLNLGAPTFSCQHCEALFWYEERLRRGMNTQNPKYNLCCRGGRLLLPRYEDPPPLQPLMSLLASQSLLLSRHFFDHI